MDLTNQGASAGGDDASGACARSHLVDLADGPVRIEAFGRPRTKGSLKPVHVKLGPGRCRVSLTESGEYAVAWKKTMIRAIREQCVIGRFSGAVVVDTFFRFERLCEPDREMLWPTRAAGEYAHGDEDKLRRNALDALTQSGLILDDALVIGGRPYKRWCRGGEAAGVIIKVRPADERDDLAYILMLER